MKLAIVGSRNLIDKILFAEGIDKALREWGRPDKVISGGCKGADTLGTQWARQEGISVQIFKAKWTKYKRGAGIRRNAKIIAEATHVLAFPSHKGKGTQDSVRRAKEKKLPLIEIWID